jgi:hypothetical protein
MEQTIERVEIADPQANGRVSEVINEKLRQHQQDVGSWQYSAVMSDLHVWAERMNVEFKLNTGCPPLRIDRLRRAYGQFRRGRNSFGLRDEIAIDKDHLDLYPYWRVLGTLFHELLHSWQEHHGTPSSSKYHNRQFRTMAAGYGLLVSRSGFTQYRSGETPFMLFLARYGVTPPPQQQINEELPVGRKAKPKLHLYTCPCGVRARIGLKHFNARCLDCGGQFVLVE